GRGERDEHERFAVASPGGRRGDDVSLGRPRGGERPWVGGARSQILLGPHARGLGVPEVGGELDCYLLSDRVGNAEPAPLLPALLDELAHEATSTLTGASTASTASRTARHSSTPAPSATLPALDGW